MTATEPTTAAVTDLFAALREHPDYQTFVRAVAEHPDDDVTRLVFADWLQDHGFEAHAELLRRCPSSALRRAARDLGAALSAALAPVAAALQTLSAAMALALQPVATALGALAPHLPPQEEPAGD